jgi:large subunit ribosomal protein L32
MAVPKYRPSSQRQGRRRRTHKVKLPDVSKCQFCGAEKKPHFACPNCGKIGTKGKEQSENKTESKETKKSTSTKKAKTKKKTSKSNKKKTNKNKKNDSQKEK